MKVKQLIEDLQNNFDPEETIARSLWSREDVREIAKEHMGLGRLSDKTCDEVLEFFEDHCDAEIGLNWMGLQDSISEVLDKRKEPKWHLYPGLSFQRRKDLLNYAKKAGLVVERWKEHKHYYREVSQKESKE